MFHLQQTFGQVEQHKLFTSKVLSTSEMPERHTGIYIQDRLRKIAKKWNIYDKVSALVHDNAANMVLGSELLDEWGDLGCTHFNLPLTQVLI